MMALMNKAELAAYLGVTEGWLTKAITKRKCPRITWVGRHARFDPADVEAWVAARKEKPATVKAAPALELVPQLGHPPAGPRPTPPPPPRPGRERAA